MPVQRCAEALGGNAVVNTHDLRTWESSLDEKFPDKIANDRGAHRSAPHDAKLECFPRVIGTSQFHRAVISDDGLGSGESPGNAGVEILIRQVRMNQIDLLALHRRHERARKAEIGPGVPLNQMGLDSALQQPLPKPSVMAKHHDGTEALGIKPRGEVEEHRFRSSRAAGLYSVQYREFLHVNFR